MSKSKNYDLVKMYYESGKWDLQKVRKAVGLWITPAEYKEITGEEF